MNERFASIDQADWGHITEEMDAAEIADRLRSEIEAGLGAFRVLPECECSTANPPFSRAWVEVPVSEALFSALMNGRSGYRAHYAQSIEQGETFNRWIIERVVSPIIAFRECYEGTMTGDFVAASLRGPHTKIWFPKAISDPSASVWRSGLPEVIRWPQWVSYWKHKARPRKGLLAPVPEEPAILLNGTFVAPDASSVWEQKPCRSRELHKRGWT